MRGALLQTKRQMPGWWLLVVSPWTRTRCRCVPHSPPFYQFVPLRPGLLEATPAAHQSQFAVPGGVCVVAVRRVGQMKESPSEGEVETSLQFAEGIGSRMPLQPFGTGPVSVVAETVALQYVAVETRAATEVVAAAQIVGPGFVVVPVADGCAAVGG